MQLKILISIITITFAFSQDPEALFSQAESQLESGDLTGADNPKQITIDKAKTVKAVFVKK